MKILKMLVIVGVVFFLQACLFDEPQTTKQNFDQYPKFQVKNPITGTTDLLPILTKETSYSGGSTREVYAPLYITENANFAGKRTSISKELDFTLIERSQRHRYIVRSQKFGYWNPTLEKIWVHFALQSYHLNGDSIWVNLDSNQSIEDIVKLFRDPFSEYIDSSNANAYLSDILTTTVPGAIGIRLETNNTGDSLKITQVAPNSPASEAGIQAEDILLKINDTSVTGDSAATRFSVATKGDSGTVLTITFFNSTQGIQTKTIIKRPVQFPSVLVDTLGNYGYIRVFSFSGETLPNDSTSGEFKRALQATAGFSKTILDFRGNGGGLVSAAEEMLDEMSDGVLFRTNNRDLYGSKSGYTEEIIRGTAGGAGLNRSYIGLIDTNTASASEIFLASLIENGKIVLYGQNTYGKGIGQAMIPTPGSGLLRVTVASYTSPGNISYHKKGIPPDVATSSRTALEKALLAEGPLAKKGLSKSLKNKLELLEFDARERQQRVFVPEIEHWEFPR